MLSFTLNVLSILLVGAWVKWRPHPRLRTLAWLWFLGLVLYTCLPEVLIASSFRHLGHPLPPGIVDHLADIGVWIGAVLALRALLGFTLWSRPDRRRERVWFLLFAVWLLLFAVWLLLVPLARPGNAWSGIVFPLARRSWINWLCVLLPIPWLWSYRWRDGRGFVAHLAILGLGLCSILLLSTRFTSLTGGSHGGISSGRGQLLWADPNPLLAFAGTVWQCGPLYLLLFLPYLAARAHLSIRRISLRLVGSHILAGFVPLGLLALIGLLAGTLFLAGYRGDSAVRHFVQASADARDRLRMELAADGNLEAAAIPKSDRARILLFKEGDAAARTSDSTFAVLSPDSLLLLDAPSDSVPFLLVGPRLYSRARLDTTSHGKRVRVEALEPVDSLTMAAVSQILGKPVRLNPQGAGNWSPEGYARDLDADQPFAAAARPIGPAGRGWPDLPGGAIASCLVWSGSGWQRVWFPVSTSASLGEPFLNVREMASGAVGGVAMSALSLFAFLLIGVAWLTVVIVFDMARSIQRSVRALKAATNALGQGRLDHRIEIRGGDELWDVAASFNQMAGNLEHAREVEVRAQRMEEELRLAHDIQARLLPTSAPKVDRFEVAGMSVPAREVGGDAFDYLELPDGRIGIVVADVSGKGVPAALLMSAFHAALRSQDLSAMGPAKVVAQLNRFIHSRVETGKFITAFLAVLEPESGEICYTNAGHEPPLLCHPGRPPKQLAGGGLILGFLPDFVYTEERVHLEPGSLLVIFSDGVTEARNAQGEFFGEERLQEAVREGEARPCAELLERLTQAIARFAGEETQSDDITMVLVRRLGKPRPVPA